MRLIILAALLFASHSDAGDVSHLQSLNDLDHFYVENEAVDRGYHICVKRPPEFDVEESYPVIYLLDGGNHLPLMAAYHRLMLFGEDVSPAILVGISYGADSFEDGNYRSTDFTAPSEERDYWGGAAAFRDFMTETLIPSVESRYPVRKDRRILFGHSLGGQFVLFVAQTRPDIFWGYLASNPALHRNLDFFLETKPASNSNAKVFVGSGTEDAERFRVPARRWIEHWQAMEERPWALKAVDLPGHSHMSAPPAVYRQGLQWLFEETRPE